MPWGLFTGSKAQKSYYLRTKHTFPRKYGTKKPKNRPQKDKNQSFFLNQAKRLRLRSLAAGWQEGGRAPGGWKEKPKVFALTFVGSRIVSKP